MSAPAEIIVTGERAVFEADSCRVEYGAVFAEGRWRWRWGPNNRNTRFSEPVSRTWPVARCEVRWAEARAAA